MLLSFGRRAGYAIAEFIHGGAQLHPISGDPARKQVERVTRLMDDSAVNGKRENFSALAEELKWNMTNNCGIYRDGERLELGLKKVKELQDRFQLARVMDKSSRFNTDVLGAMEAENLFEFAEVVVSSALNRAESRGAHYRTDYRKRNDDQWLKHTMAHRAEDGPRLDYKDVNIDWEKYPPQERKY